MLCELNHRWHRLAVEYGVWLLLVPVFACHWGLRLNGESGSKRRQRQEGVEYGAHRGGGGRLPSEGSGARVTILLLYYKPG
jgi:hypothetical protein